MRISARNVLEGKIVEIKEGPVSTEVTIETPAGEKIVSSITTNSAKTLGLKVGGKAYAVIKASNVMVAVDKLATNSLLQGARLRSGAFSYATDRSPHFFGGKEEGA